MNNEGRNRFNNDGSRNAYVYTGSAPRFYDEEEIQEEMSIPLFILVNGLFFGILLYLLYTADYSKLPKELELIDFNTSAIGLSISWFYLICYELLVRKTGKPWWGLFIPFYNMYLMLFLAFDKPLKTILAYILLYIALAVAIYFMPQTPLADYQIYAKYAYGILVSLFPIIYTFNFAESFGRSGVLMILIGFVLIPFTAFSKRYQFERKKYKFVI